MAATKTLAAAVRSGTGKGAARSVRREGRVPAVIYGGGDAAEPISLDHRETHKQIYAGHFLTTIFDDRHRGPQGAGHPARLPARQASRTRRSTSTSSGCARASKLRLEIPVHLVNARDRPPASSAAAR